MRAGKLDTRLSIFSGGDEVGGIWANVQPPTSVNGDSGLLDSSQTLIVVRSDDRLFVGMLLKAAGQTYLIDGLVPDGARSGMLTISSTRIVGVPATYTKVSGQSIDTLAFVSLSTPYIGQAGNVMEHRYRVEILSTLKPSNFDVGDTIIIGSKSYDLIGPHENGDDGKVITYMA